MLKLAFNYFADKNSTVNKKECKMKKLTEITMQFIFPEESWYLCIPAVYPAVYPAVLNEAIFWTKWHLWEKEMVSPDKWNWTERPANDWEVVFLSGVFFQMNKFVILHWGSFICFCFRRFLYQAMWNRTRGKSFYITMSDQWKLLRVISIGLDGIWTQVRNLREEI